MDKIVLTGGGTAGHVMPNIALIPYLSEFELHYIGRPDSMEEELVRKNAPNVIYHALECVKLSRQLTLKNLSVPFKLAASKKKAKALLETLQPKAVFSKGGYVALPVMLAAGNIPLILHESDFTMGLANRMGVKKCSRVCTSFAPLAEKVKNGICTGAPLRREIYSGSKARAEAESGLKGRINLLITGGSLGAQAVNDAVAKNLDKLLEQFNVAHITGKQNALPARRPHYYPIPFTDKIADYFAWADYCITRGGANALFELVALKIPSLVIPLPKGASRGDQIDNAAYFEGLGCVKVLEQSNITESPSALLSALDGLIFNRLKLRAACADAKNIDGTERIAQLIKEAAHRS